MDIYIRNYIPYYGKYYAHILITIPTESEGTISRMEFQESHEAHL